MGTGTAHFSNGRTAIEGILKMTECLIYALYRIKTGECYYVGQTSDLQARLRGHYGQGRYDTRIHYYAVLESPVSALRAGERERHWIKHFKKLGSPLENSSDGGESPMRRHKARFYLLNTGKYYASEKALRQACGTSIREFKSALELSKRTKDIVETYSWESVTERIWLIDLEHAPNWKPAPDYQI